MGIGTFVEIDEETSCLIDAISQRLEINAREVIARAVRGARARMRGILGEEDRMGRAACAARAEQKK